MLKHTLFLMTLCVLCLGAEVKIYDVTGRLVTKAEETETGDFRLLDQVPNGIYFTISDRVLVTNGKTVRVRTDGREGVPTPVPHEFTVEVDKPGWVRQGFPLRQGALRRGRAIQVYDGPQLVASVQKKVATWPDRSTKMSLLTFHAPRAGEYRVVVTRKAVSSPLPLRSRVVAPFSVTLNGTQFDLDYETQSTHSLLTTGMASDRSENLELVAYTLWFGDGATRSYVRLTNKTPCGLSGGGWQPDCKDYGKSTERSADLVLTSGDVLNVRWAQEIGATSGTSVSLMSGTGQLGALRAGESRAWEIATRQDAEPPLALASSEHYVDTGILDLAAYPNDLEYEANVLAGIERIHADRTSRAWWANSRDWGEDFRDWDTPDGETWGTHNDEYDANQGYLLQALRMAGTSRGDLARKAFRLAETGAVHHATVDVNAITVDESHPNIRWVAGANWQHTNHGDSGSTDAHRSEFSPHLSHASGRACMWMYLFTGNPLMLDGFEYISDNAHWRIENPSSGHPELDGEGRIAGHSLGIVLDALELGLYPARSRNVARTIIDEQMTRGIYSGSGEKYKPWMVSIFAVQVKRAERLLGDPSIGDQYTTVCNLLETSVRVDSDGNKYIPYKINPDTGDHGDMWSVTAADALVDHNPGLALELFETGSAHIWYPGHPVGVYSRLLQHAVLNTYGQRVMRLTQ